MTHDSKELPPSDILDQLREYATDWRTRAISPREVHEAIAEIERLRAMQPTPQQSADAVKQSFYSYCLNARVGR